MSNWKVYIKFQPEHFLKIERDGERERETETVRRAQGHCLFPPLFDLLLTLSLSDHLGKMMMAN